MPRRGRQRLPEIAELARQLVYAPPATRRRQMARIESLVGDILPEARYPLGFVVFRISGYRPEEDGPLLAGAPLRRDLVELVRTLSEDLDLRFDERGGALPLAEAAAIGGVTERTLHRWRRDGLCVHRATLADGSRPLVVFREVLDRFLARRRSDGPARRPPTRFTVAERTSILARFRACIESGRAATAAAESIADAFDRSREAIRQLLLREGCWPVRTRAISDASFDRLLLRGFDLGIGPREVAVRHGRDAAAAARRCRVLRRRRLLEVELPTREFPTFAREDAADVIVSSPKAKRGLARAWWIDRPDAMRLIEDAHRMRIAATTFADAEAMLAVEAWLLADASSRIHAASATESALDPIETSLRWSTLIRARVVDALMPLIVDRAEQTLGGPMSARTSAEIAGLFGAAFEEVGKILDGYEPAIRSGPARSLRGVATLALDRRYATQVATFPTRRAAARHESVPLADPVPAIAPWSAPIGLGRHLRRRRSVLDASTRDLLDRRWGWGDERPLAIEDLLQEEGGTRPRLLGRLHAAELDLRPRAPRPTLE